MPNNFLLDARHCEFYLFAAGYFSTSIHILELYNEVQLSGNSLIPLGLLRFISQD